ncbi:hypothetical protein BKA93DRAFT_854015 [Sparassis latifolia]
MSRTQIATLEKLCGRQETFTKSEALFHSAVAKTGPGSGYSLGDASVGLPAICAYIASLELGNGDVSEKVAQTASCVTVKQFKTAVQTVRAALAAAAAPSQELETALSYDSLMRKYHVGRKRFVHDCLCDVEKALVASRELPPDLHPPCDAVTVAVFYWTCAVMKRKNIQPEVVLRERGLVRDDYDEIIDILRTSCQDVALKVDAKVAELRKEVPTPTAGPSASTSSATATPNVSPTKSPTKSALKTRPLDASPTKTPTHKRKVAFHDLATDEDQSVLETPTKKRRTSPAKPRGPFPDSATSSSRAMLNPLQTSEEDLDRSQQPAFPLVATADFSGQGPSTPRRRAPQTPTSARRASSNGLETPTSVSRMGRQAPRLEILDEPPRPRFRPVYLDHRQWVSRDPRIEREWRLVEEFRRSLVVSNRAEVGA